MLQLGEIDFLAYPLVAGLRDYWDSKCLGGTIPRRDDIDPSEIVGLLPVILISDLTHSPFRIRYRLVGTRIVRIAGFNFTGQYLHELAPPNIAAEWLGAYTLSWERRVPTYGVAHVVPKQTRSFYYGFGIFPLRVTTDAVEQFIAVEDMAGQEPESDQFTPVLASVWSRQKPT